MQLVPMYAGKIKNLKELYEFRVLQKKHVNCSQKEIGTEPDHNQLMYIFFSFIDMNSKQLISSAGLDKKRIDPETKTEISMYKTFVEDIDQRYNSAFRDVGDQAEEG